MGLKIPEHRNPKKHTLSRLTSRAHVNKGVVDQNQLVEVEFIGEPLAFGFMKDPLVVVVSVRAQQHRHNK